jgi:formylglycine-generating enzyme required for sulfatase activity
MPATSADLLKVLRKLNLLPAERLRAVAELAGTIPEATHLADELAGRGWLSAYQVGEVLRGRGEGLVAGPYHILEPVGRGGMGQVFRARHTVLEREVALKLILPERLGSQQSLDRFLREAKAAAILSHPNIVTVYDAGQVGDNFYLAMELLEGVNLAEYLGQHGQLPVAEACDYVRQAALGLQHAHEKGLVHRDIKPANLWRTGAGQIKVLDLGLALVLAATTLTREPGAFMGTIDYMAPEQADDAHKVDIRADVYSLGCTLYHLLAGKVPFHDAHPSARILVRQHQDPTPVIQHRPNLPAPLSGVLGRMLARRVEDRYQTPGEAAEALLPFTAPAKPAGQPGVPPLPAEPSGVTSRWPSTLAPEPRKDRGGSTLAMPGSRRRLPWLVVAMALVLVVVPCAGLTALILSALSDRDESKRKQAAQQQGLPAVTGPGMPHEIVNSIGMKLVLIRAGTFKMGSPTGEGSDKERPQHEVEITRPFYLGVYEVTQGQFKRVMGYNPSYFSRDGTNAPGAAYFDWSRPAGGKDQMKHLDSHEDLPVENVSWEEAQTFLKKLSDLPKEKNLLRKYRLPTEAEWEYSCRGGALASTSYHFGSTITSSQANFNNHVGRTTEVGSYKKPNGFGLNDMHGNVWEWCSDYLSSDYYINSPRQDPPGPTQGPLHVLRGGSWSNPGERCRSACRSWAGAGERGRDIGFRAAVTLSRE